jgi:heme/copper-type cytochrome/quinol oxidase subunit 4
LVYRAGGRNGGPVGITISVVATVIPFLVVLGPALLAGSLNPIRLIAIVVAAIAAGAANRQF